MRNPRFKPVPHQLTTSIKYSGYLTIKPAIKTLTRFSKKPPNLHVIAHSPHYPNMSGIFSNRLKLPLHLVELFLIIAVLILSVVRMLKQPANAPKGTIHYNGIGNGRNYSSYHLRYRLTNLVSECKVPCYFVVPAIIRTRARIQKVVQPQSLRYSKCA